jgi:RHS repeat-associated protein
VDQLAAVTSNYTYDSIYQLTQTMQGSSTTESYSYDPVGNRTASLGVSSYTTNASNEMTANSNASYTYDSNGNTLTKTVGSNTTSYTWDYENRLTSVTLPGTGGTVSFKYDPLGRRIEKSSTATTSVFAYDGDNLIEEANSSGTVVARYTQTQNIDEPLAMLRSSATSYYNADGLGSVTSLTNSSGAAAQSYTYDSFGNVTASSGSLTNPFQYTGREMDAETGLYYYRARYYDPSMGRFLSQDLIKFDGGVNFYVYTRNNPVTFADQSGLCDPKCVAELKFRSVMGTPGNHAFWRVVDRHGVQRFIDAGPAGLGFTLNAWVMAGDHGHYREDNNSAATWFKAGPSTEVCDQVDWMIDAGNDWPNNTIPYWFSGRDNGPNSNTFARYIGLVGGFYPSPPPNAPAWNNPI